MKSTIIILALVLCCSNSIFSQNRDTIDKYRYEISGFENVSLIQLIANPKLYHNKRVLVFGYLHLKFEDNVLYLSKSDADYLNKNNAVWVVFNDSVRLEPKNKRKSVSLEYFDCKYVMLKGTFNYEERGHEGRNIGAIEKIDRIREVTKYYDGKKELSN